MTEFANVLLPAIWMASGVLIGYVLHEWWANR